MVMRNDSETNSTLPSGEVIGPAPDLNAAQSTIDAPIVAEPANPETISSAPIGTELRSFDASSIKALTAVAAIAEAPMVEAPKVEQKETADTIEARIATTIALQRIAAAIDAPERASPKPLMADDPPLPPLSPQVTAAPETITRPSNRVTWLAASVAVAACFGATVAALALSGSAQRDAPPAAVTVQSLVAADDMQTLQGTIVQLRSELAALRTSVEAGTKSTSAQFARMSERIDRVQTEQAVRNNRAPESADRFDKRVDAAPARDMTGSVPQFVPQPAIASLQGAQAIVQGWVLRDVNQGVAIIQGARYGTIEVEAGDMVPGLGRIDAIRKQNNRWVVVTSRGLVTTLR